MRILSIASLALAVAVAACDTSSSRDTAAPKSDAGIDASVASGPWTARKSGTTSTLRAVWGSGQDIFAAGEDATLIHSSDGGATWIASTLVDAPSTSFPRFTAIGGSGADDVYVLGKQYGRHDFVLHSSDRAASWQPVDLGAVGVGAAFNGIWANARDDVYVSTYDAGILHSIDGGATWTRAFRQERTYLYGIWGSGPGDVYAVGGVSSVDEAGIGSDGGTSLTGEVLHSVDRGLSWTVVASTTTGILWSISGSPDGARVYAVGNNATVVWTTDHGATFNASGVPVAQDGLQLFAVWCAPDTPEPFILGDLADTGVLRSVDASGGSVVSWREDRPPSHSLSPESGGANASAVWGTREHDVWAVGAAGALWHRD
jgi:photosystem II stability/assembly factor-like uncharacterized protein